MESETKRHPIIDYLLRERRRLVRVFRFRMADLDETDIEDVIQDVIVHFIAQEDLAASVGNLAAYVYRAVKNRLLDVLKSRRRSVSLDEPPLPDGEVTLGETLPAPVDLAGVLAERELRAGLFAALDELEPKQRAVWVATELEGRTFRELAEAWGEPLNTLLSRKRRAAQALLAALQDFLP